MVLICTTLFGGQQNDIPEPYFRVLPDHSPGSGWVTGPKVCGDGCYVAGQEILNSHELDVSRKYTHLTEQGKINENTHAVAQ